MREEFPSAPYNRIRVAAADHRTNRGIIRRYAQVYFCEGQKAGIRMDILNKLCQNWKII